MSRYVVPLVVVLSFVIDATCNGLGHALLWLFGVVTGMAIGATRY